MWRQLADDHWIAEAGKYTLECAILDEMTSWSWRILDETHMEIAEDGGAATIDEAKDQAVVALAKLENGFV